MSTTFPFLMSSVKAKAPSKANALAQRIGRWIVDCPLIIQLSRLLCHALHVRVPERQLVSKVMERFLGTIGLLLLRAAYTVRVSGGDHAGRINEVVDVRQLAILPAAHSLLEEAVSAEHIVRNPIRLLRQHTGRAAWLRWVRHRAMLRPADAPRIFITASAIAGR